MQKNQRYLDPSELLQEPEAGGNFLQRVPAAKPVAAAKGDKGAKKRTKRGRSSSSSSRCCASSPNHDMELGAVPSHGPQAPAAQFVSQSCAPGSSANLGASECKTCVGSSSRRICGLSGYGQKGYHVVKVTMSCPAVPAAATAAAARDPAAARTPTPAAAAAIVTPIPRAARGPGAAAAAAAAPTAAGEA